MQPLAYQNPTPQLGSFFDLQLLCHQIILAGKERYVRACREPLEALRLELPLLLVGDWVAAVAVVMLLVLRSYCAPDTTLWC